MKPHLKVEVTVGLLCTMSAEQFEALKENVLGEGRWETADGLRIVSGGGGDDIGVIPQMFRAEDPEHKLHEIIYIGIEKDGYTHS